VVCCRTCTREQKVPVVVISMLQILLINKGLPQHTLSNLDLFGGFDLRRLCKLINRFLQVRKICVTRAAGGIGMSSTQ